MAITTFIPEIWSARLLYALDKAHVATNLVNRNYEGVIANQGDTVHINSIGAVTVKDYTKNTNIADPEVLTTSYQTLDIDQAKYFNFQVDDVDKAQISGEIIDTAMGRSAYALADVSDAFLLKTIANGAASANKIGAKTTLTALTASNVYENIVKMRTLLDKANVPTTGRTIVVPPEVYALLLLDDRFAKSGSDSGQNALLNGMVGRVAGFDVFFQRNRKNLLSMEKAYLIGAGANYGTALEGAVKIGETVHILAVGYEVDEAIHGPQIQLTPNYNFIFIDPGDETAARIEQSYRAAKAISDRVYILSNNPLIQGDGVMRVPHQVDEMISPLYTLAFVQMMAYAVSETNSTWKQHPLMKEYKAILFGKSDTYQAYDCT